MTLEQIRVGVTDRGWRFLDALSNSTRPMRVKELSELCGMKSIASGSEGVKSLRLTGLVERVSQREGHAYQLSVKGQALVEAIRGLREFDPPAFIGG